MTDIKENTDYPRSAFEQILMKIPGFKGYLKKEFRREADQALRIYLWQQLEEAKNTVVTVMKKMTDSGRIKELSPTNDILNQLEKISNRIRYASHGYRGFYDLVKIDESYLDKLYNFDKNLLSQIENIMNSTASLISIFTDSKYFLQKCSQISIFLRKLDVILNDRDNVVNKINK